MTGKELQEKLGWKFPDIAEKHPEQVEEAGRFCEGYKEFLNEGKTERECVKKAVEMLEQAGYRPFDRSVSYAAGDKIYQVNRSKGITLSVIGKKPLAEGVRLTAAHLDAPRVDIRTVPLYEDGGMAFFKTHYYGGIK